MEAAAERAAAAEITTAERSATASSAEAEIMAAARLAEAATDTASSLFYSAWLSVTRVVGHSRYSRELI